MPLCLALWGNRWRRAPRPRSTSGPRSRFLTPMRGFARWRPAGPTVSHPPQLDRRPTSHALRRHEQQVHQHDPRRGQEADGHQAPHRAGASDCGGLHALPSAFDHGSASWKLSQHWFAEPALLPPFMCRTSPPRPATARGTWRRCPPPRCPPPSTCAPTSPGRPTSPLWCATRAPAAPAGPSAPLRPS